MLPAADRLAVDRLNFVYEPYTADLMMSTDDGGAATAPG